MPTEKSDTPLTNPPPLESMSNESLLELYQQISGRVSMYNTDVLIDRMFEIQRFIVAKLTALEVVATRQREALDSVRKWCTKGDTVIQCGQDVFALIKDALALTPQFGGQSVTTQAQRIAIAKACGYFHAKRGVDVWYEPEGGHVVFGDLPNYLNDLNAMHEAEKHKEIKDKIVTYYSWLCAIGGGAPFACTATAAQRAEAFLRTLNLWTD